MRKSSAKFAIAQKEILEIKNLVKKTLPLGEITT